MAASPAVDSDGNVYFGSEDGSLHRCDSGLNLEWEYPGGGHFFSSPALDEEKNRLYIGSTDNYLHAIDMNTGERIWRYKTGAKIVSSPVVGFDHTIYAGSLDGFLYAVNPDGSLKWRFYAGERIEGSAALDRDGTIFFGTSSFRGEAEPGGTNGLYAVSTTGQKKWFEQNLQGFPSAPIIGDSGVVSAGSWDNKLYGIDRSGGRLIMYKTFDDDMVSAAALASNGYLFAGAKDSSFYGLDFEDGDERSGRNEHWHYRLDRPLTPSAPVVSNGYVYVGTCENRGGKDSKGSMYSFLAHENQKNMDVQPAEDSPWPQFRNRSQNTGMTELRPGTVAPEVAEADPAPGVSEFDTGRRSISSKFSMPMDPESIYRPPGTEGEDDEGFVGFTVEPFDADPEEFEIDWNDEQTMFTLTLPDGVSFEAEKQYTATIQSDARAVEPHSDDGSERSLLYDYEWTFEHAPEESRDNSHSRFTCFISSIADSSLQRLLPDLW